MIGSRADSPRELASLDSELPELCDELLRAESVPGAAVAVVSEDEGFLLPWGVRTLGAEGAVTAATGFNIGSCSKAFVSATLATLVSEGLLRWDDPIAEMVPEFRLYDPVITRMATLRDLGSNRLGLPRGGLPDYGFAPTVSIETALGALEHTPPLHPFRDRFTYVNGGHSANALAAGRVDGRGFLGALRARIFEPLGMSDSSGGSHAPAPASPAPPACRP